MIPYNFHTHTKRCGHAVGEDEDYVIEAIAAGVRVLGFSDHIMQPGVVQNGIRGTFDELPGYLESIRSLKHKYQDRIKIMIGFEAEYAVAFVDFYKELLETKQVDYLILGQHYKYREKTIINYFGNAHEKESLYEYRDLVVAALHSGMFKCVAHPDLYMASYTSFDTHAKKVAIDICKASLETDVPLEINLAGLRYGLRTIGGIQRYTYPFTQFWKVAAKMGCKVIIGVDAHNPNDFKTNEYSIALKLIRELGLNHVSSIL